MSTCRQYTFITLELLLHVVFLVGPIWTSGILHNSDSLMTQVPAQIDVANNITNVGFGIKKFSIGEDNEDIEFSDEQKDALGASWQSSHTSYHILVAFMIVSIMIPIIIAIKQRLCCRMNTTIVFSKLMKNLAVWSIPFVILFTILMTVPFVLLSRSNLCGPNYIELRFQEGLEDSEDSEDTGSRDNDDCNSSLQGTIAIVHEDINASCSVGAGGIVAAVWMAVWPLLMVGQACLLNWRGSNLESESMNATANEHAIVIEVYESGEKKEEPRDDNTLDSKEASSDNGIGIQIA